MTTAWQAYTFEDLAWRSPSLLKRELDPMVLAAFSSGAMHGIDLFDYESLSSCIARVVPMSVSASQLSGSLRVTPGHSGHSRSHKPGFGSEPPTIRKPRCVNLPSSREFVACVGLAMLASPFKPRHATKERPRGRKCQSHAPARDPIGPCQLLSLPIQATCRQQAIQDRGSLFPTATFSGNPVGTCICCLQTIFPSSEDLTLQQHRDSAARSRSLRDQEWCQYNQPSQDYETPRP